MKFLPYHILTLSKNGNELIFIYNYFKNNETSKCPKAYLNLLQSIQFDIQYTIEKLSECE